MKSSSRKVRIKGETFFPQFLRSVPPPSFCPRVCQTVSSIASKLGCPFFFSLAMEISSIHAAVERLDRGEEEKKRLYACPESDETFMMCFGSHPVILAEEMKN